MEGQRQAAPHLATLTALNKSLRCLKNNLGDTSVSETWNQDKALPGEEEMTFGVDIPA